MTSATAAAPVRLALAAVFLFATLAVVLVGRADGAAQGWSAYLAPSAACPGADDAAAPRADQRQAITCLVNWARAHDGRGRLARSKGLQRAASLKGYHVASCGQLSHTPCSTGVTDAVRAAGYRYASFGENLFAGVDRLATPRDVVQAWLHSPPHRANLLRPGFRQLGIAGVRTHALLGNVDSIVWVAAFGTPR